MQTENLFQVFSQVFIESQQSFNKCDVELRTKCRTLASKLTNLVDDLENDPFKADLGKIATLEEDVLHIIRSATELENRREYIQKSVESLQTSTKSRLSKRR